MCRVMSPGARLLVNDVLDGRDLAEHLDGVPPGGQELERVAGFIAAKRAEGNRVP